MYRCRMERLRTPGTLAPAVAGALLRGGTDASDDEVSLVERSVSHSVSAMPDLLAVGVRGVSAVAGGALFVLGRGDFRRQSRDRQVALSERLATLPLPGVAEYVRLTRGLGLVALYESRAADGGAGAPSQSRAG